MFRQRAFVGLALALLAPDHALAKGGYVRPPQLQPFPAIIVHPPTTISLPPGPLIRHCGPKRYINARTHQCQGPSDWR